MDLLEYERREVLASIVERLRGREKSPACQSLNAGFVLLEHLSERAATVPGAPGGCRLAPSGSPAFFADKYLVIRLTRLNQVPLVINSDLIEHVEITPDTVIALTTGQKILVLETADEVIERVVRFRRSVLAGLPSGLQRLKPC